MTDVPRVLIHLVLLLSWASIGAAGQTPDGSQRTSEPPLNGSRYPLLYVNDGFAVLATSSGDERHRIVRAESARWSESPWELLIGSDEGVSLYDLRSRSSRALLPDASLHHWAQRGSSALYAKDGGIRLAELEPGSSRRVVSKGTTPLWMGDDRFLYQHEDLLRLHSLDEGRSRTVVHAADEFAVSPDGERIAYCLTTGQMATSEAFFVPLDRIGEEIGRSTLYACGVDGGDRRVLHAVRLTAAGTEGILGTDLKWSPDGRCIASISSRARAVKDDFTRKTAPLFEYSLSVHDLALGETTPVEAGLENTFVAHWIGGSRRLAVEGQEETSYLAVSGGETVKVILAPRALTPASIAEIGLDKSVLENDRITLYDLRTRTKRSFSGHGLHVFPGFRSDESGALEEAIVDGPPSPARETGPRFDPAEVERLRGRAERAGVRDLYIIVAGDTLTSSGTDKTVLWNAAARSVYGRSKVSRLEVGVKGRDVFDETFRSIGIEGGLQEDKLYEFWHPKLVVAVPAADKRLVWERWIGDVVGRATVDAE